MTIFAVNNYELIIMPIKQTVHINTKYIADSNIVEFVNTIHTSFSSAGQVAYDKRNQLRIIETGSEAMDQVAVKRFKKLGFFRGLYYTFFGLSKAERCFNNALELARRGISTPEPLAMVEVKKNGVINTCYYICRCVQLPAIIDGLHWEDKFNPVMSADFACMAARMHEAGVIHGDLNCDNVLYKKEADGHYSFTLIDINRMTIFPEVRPVSDKKAMADMCCFTRSLNVMRKVASDYVDARGWNQSVTETMVRMKDRFNRRRALRKRILHPTCPY